MNSKFEIRHACGLDWARILKENLCGLMSMNVEVSPELRQNPTYSTVDI